MDLRIEKKRAQSIDSPRQSLDTDDHESVENLPVIPCWICQKSISSLAAWRKHIVEIHQVPLVYRCVVEDCRQEYATWNDLYEHRTEHSQRSYVCKACNDHQPTRTTLAGHSNTHENMGSRALPVTCAYCGEVTHENLETHRTKCVRVVRQTVPCPKCGAKVKKARLQRHILVNHSDVKGHLCELCDSAFQVKDRLTQHMKNVHGPRKFVCTDCGTAFKRNDKLQRHCQSRHSDVKPFLCPMMTCGRAFKRIDGLRAHIKCAHATEASGSSMNQYSCTICGCLLTGNEPFLDHMMSHVKASAPSLVTSSLSSELYGGGGANNNRQDDDQGPAHRDCPHCNARFTNDIGYQAHMIQHSNAQQMLSHFQALGLPTQQT